MNIYIQKIRKEDDFTSIIDAINRNFEEIVSAGGGPRGKIGLTGNAVPGRPGKKGIKGDNGLDGSIWHISTASVSGLDSKTPSDFASSNNYEFIILNPLSGAFYGYSAANGWSDVEYLGDPNTETPLSRNEHNSIGGRDFIIPKNTSDTLSLINIYDNGSNLQSVYINASSSESTYGSAGDATTFPLTSGAIFPGPSLIQLSPVDFKLVIATSYDASSIGTGPVAPLAFLSNTGKYNAGNDANTSAWALGISENIDDDFAILKFIKAGTTKSHFVEYSGDKFILNNSSKDPEVIKVEMESPSTIYGASVIMDFTDALMIPSGSTAQRPSKFKNGMIRYNITLGLFEGMSNNVWVSLGGTKDVDGDTYILTEITSGSDEDQFYFYAGGILKAELKGTANTQFATPDTLATIQPKDLLIYGGKDAGSTLYGDIILQHNTNPLGNVGIKTDPLYSLDISGATDGIRLPIGTTAQRPGGTKGLIRYNSSKDWIEFKSNSAWEPVAGTILRDLDNDTYVKVELNGNDDDIIEMYVNGTQAFYLDKHARSNGTYEEGNVDLTLFGSIKLTPDNTHPNGIYFSSQGETFASTEVHKRTLDDYYYDDDNEPFLRFYTGSSPELNWWSGYGLVSANSNYQYTKIGHSVHVQGTIEFLTVPATIDSDTFDTMKIILPFVGKNITGQSQYIDCIMHSSNTGLFPTGTIKLIGEIIPGETYATLKVMEIDGDISPLTSSFIDGLIATTYTISWWGTYFTANRSWTDGTTSTPPG